MRLGVLQRELLDGLEHHEDAIRRLALKVALALCHAIALACRAVKLKADRDADRIFGWVLEMWGYTIAAASVGIKHRVSNLQIEPGDRIISVNAVPGTKATVNASASAAQGGRNWTGRRDLQIGKEDEASWTDMSWRTTACAQGDTCR